MSLYKVGQRWLSEAEPELGLGLVMEVLARTVTILFPGSDGMRTYGISGAPLRRVIFDVGEEIIDKQDQAHIVRSILESDGIYSYECDDLSINETEISGNITFNRPEERFLVGQFDSNDLFNLRYQTLKKKQFMQHSSVRGLVGGRISRIPHQLFIADQITSNDFPRVLLADEVGLGKTIEAGLIIHKLLLSGRAERVLVVVPDSLAYQWFVEMLRKFRLSFAVVNQEGYHEKDSNPFEENQLVITGTGFLKGSSIGRDMALAAKWDVLVIDEAHQLKWSQRECSEEYQMIEILAQATPSVLLLTATPEQMGAEGHFARLRLLDPEKYFDLTEYIEEERHFEELGNLLKYLMSNENASSFDVEKKKQLQELRGEEINFDSLEERKIAARDIVDRHGTGRIYYRNSRVKMAQEFKFFPKRLVYSYPLELIKSKRQDQALGDEIEGHAETGNLGLSFDAKSAWLIEFLQKGPDDKILLICKSKAKVLELEKVLREFTVGVSWGVFHSDLTLMARDRQAAFFAETDGARILLCTEIGSEGRNFEFCQHLILFDIPQNPDLLEQRIGRLDRIGQNKDIHIHVPCIQDSWEELFFLWYNSGLNAFEHYARAGRYAFLHMKDKLMKAFKHPKEYLKTNSESMMTLIEETREFSKKMEHQLDAGRDYLIEINSFNHDDGERLVKLVTANEGGNDLKDYMENVFEHMGVDAEDLDGESDYIRPSDNMFIPHFPCLPNDGVSVTYRRTKACEREDMEFLTWDHPMVTGVIDTILGHQYGTVAIAQRSNSQSTKIMLEAIFVMNAIAPKYLAVEKFLPITPVRVLITVEGEDLSQKWPKEVVDSKISEASTDLKKQAPRIGKERLKALIKSAHAFAEKRASEIRQNADKEATKALGHEIDRLEYLKTLNKNITPAQIERLREKMRLIEESIGHVQVGLDSFRLIF